MIMKLQWVKGVTWLLPHWCCQWQDGSPQCRGMITCLICPAVVLTQTKYLRSKPLFFVFYNVLAYFYKMLYSTSLLEDYEIEVNEVVICAMITSCWLFFPAEIWAASALSGSEEWHHSVAGVREQLDGPAWAPGSPHWEPGAHVAVWNQRMESLQRVCDHQQPSLPSAHCILTANMLSSSFSNLAFMIEMAQKELQKFRWAITGTFLLV